MSLSTSSFGAAPAPDEPLRACSPAVAASLEGVLAGREPSFEDGLGLAEAEGADLDALISVADRLRRETVGDVVTYVVNRNINFTNVCIVGCQFCGFGRSARAEDAYSLSLDEIAAKAREARELGATEVCIQGGLPRDLDGYFYRDILRAVKSAAPELHIHAFSPMEVAYGVQKTGLSIRDFLQMLRDEGLGTMPGTAAEILDDRIRGEVSPNKLPVALWIEIVTTAHRLGIRSTSTMMYGSIEEPADWVRHLLLLRRIQHDTGGFTEFVPLGFIHEQTRLYRRGRARAGASGREHQVVHALARVLLHGAIPNVQVSWVKLGFERALECLNVGGNDFSGTLMEENISKSAGASSGEYISPEEIRSMIRSIGRIPAERTTDYRIRQKFPLETGEFVGIPPRLQLTQAHAHTPNSDSGY
ncbi:MAG: 5-amino-6-(D-ribitylamino)uracil--L-tyrosine 4-hydroxyphenyl transferase CofH [Candidatus Acidiferrales bacterium]|jgi:FO synthase